MSYKKWNNALLHYYFNEDNNNEEVLLYCDEDIINEVGEKNNLGDFNDFINATTNLSIEDRRQIFDSFFTERRVDDNKSVLTQTKLKFGVLLYNKECGSGVNLSYFNYILLPILKLTLDENNDVFELINSLKNPKDFDHLFYKISKCHPEFKIGMIGKLRYQGLLKYQVVLSKKDFFDLQCLLYKYQLEFSEEETYETIINRSRLIERTEGRLQSKLKQSLKEEVFKMFFENKLKSFQLENFKEKENTENIIIEKSGYFALAFANTNDFKGMCLLTNVRVDEPIETDEFIIQSNGYSNKLSNDFYDDLILPKNNSNIEIKAYSFKSEGLLINPISKYNDIVLLQKNNNELYIQTEDPQPNTQTYILVKNDTKLIEKVITWCEKDENNVSIKSIPLEKSKLYFTENYKLFITKNIIKNFWFKPSCKKHKVKHEKNTITIFGGFKLPDANNTYLGVALPSFKIGIKDFENQNLQRTLKGDLPKIDSIIETTVEDEIVYLRLKDEDYDFDRIEVTIDFNYLFLDKNELIASYNFLIVPSQLKKIDEDAFFKYNSFGRNLKIATNQFFNNVNFSDGIETIKLNNNRHEINGLINDYSTENDVFINLLASGFYKSSKPNIKKSNKLFRDVYDAALRIVKKENKYIYEDKYSYYNLIDNLTYLGYLNKKTENGEEYLQMIPPTFSKIEKSLLTGGAQCYLLTGIRSRKFIFRLNLFCEEKGIEIKYLSAKGLNDNKVEYALLPDIVFINSTFSIQDFVEYCKEHSVFEKNDIQIQINDEINIGKTLLSFISPISEFEKHFINKATEFNNLDTTNILKSTESYFPRIRKEIIPQPYIPNKYYLETKENNFITKDNKQDDLPFKWLRLYTLYKQKIPIMILSKKRSSSTTFNYDNNVYLYKYYRLPFTVKRALTLMNNGLASEQKLFIKNSVWDENSKKYPFNIFLKYNINATDESNRNQLSNILTGNPNTTNNVQVLESIKYSDVCIHYYELKENNDIFKLKKFILIKRDNIIETLITMGNGSYANSCYVNSKICKKTATNDISIDSQTIQMSKINISEDVNKVISSIIDKDFIGLKEGKESSKEPPIIKLTEYNEEEIKLIENYQI